MIGRRTGRAATALLVTAALISGCGSGSSTAGTAKVGSVPRTIAGAPSATSPAALGPAPTPGATATAAASGGVPRFAHVVVVVEENKPFGELVGTPATPFLTGLAAKGAVLTRSYAITHPSEPNYLALFSGSTHGLTSDACPRQFTGPNLAAALLAAADTFTGYSESLPSPGYQGCRSGDYARKHSPWVDFPLPATVNQPMTAFATDFTRLPNLSFVIPDLADDMHDGSIAQGDRWLATHLAAYRDWASTHNSLLVVTTDEDDTSHANHITTILAGAHVRPGRYDTRIDHYGVLRTLLACFGLAPFAAAADAHPITAVWTA